MHFSMAAYLCGVICADAGDAKPATASVTDRANRYLFVVLMVDLLRDWEAAPVAIIHALRFLVIASTPLVLLFCAKPSADAPWGVRLWMSHLRQMPSRRRDWHSTS